MTDPRCKCTMAISVVGDGCRYCQPQEHIDRLGDIISDMESESEPTHYAVFDEHGEIVQAIKIQPGKDYKSMQSGFAMLIDSYGRNADGWTVKGVTVHE